MKILSILLLLFVLAGCSDDSSTASTGSSSTGDLLGTMQLTDHRGRLMSDHSGVTVQIEGTSFSAVSDVNGNWVIHNLPTRTYAITFSKPNFYTRRNPSYTFVAGEPVRYLDLSIPYGGYNIPSIPLGALPQFTITLDGVVLPAIIEKIDSLNKKTIIYTSGTIFAHTSANTPDSVDVGMYLIIGKNADLRIEDISTYSYLVPVLSKTPVPADTSINLTQNLYYSTVQHYGLQAGDMLYFKAYPTIGTPGQFNRITNTFEYIGNGPTPSNVLSGILQ